VRRFLRDAQVVAVVDRTSGGQEERESRNRELAET
jgi:hypothetical protein